MNKQCQAGFGELSALFGAELERWLAFVAFFSVARDGRTVGCPECDRADRAHKRGGCTGCWGRSIKGHYFGGKRREGLAEPLLLTLPNCQVGLVGIFCSGSHKVSLPWAFCMDGVHSPELLWHPNKKKKKTWLGFAEVSKEEKRTLTSGGAELGKHREPFLEIPVHMCSLGLAQL